MVEDGASSLDVQAEKNKATSTQPIIESLYSLFREFVLISS